MTIKTIYTSQKRVRSREERAWVCFIGNRNVTVAGKGIHWVPLMSRESRQWRWMLLGCRAHLDRCALIGDGFAFLNFDRVFPFRICDCIYLLVYAPDSGWNVDIHISTGTINSPPAPYKPEYPVRRFGRRGSCHTRDVSTSSLQRSCRPKHRLWRHNWPT